MVPVGHKGAGLRILLVEDEPELGQALAERLVGEGYVVDLMPSLGLAIEAAMQATYRAVLLDRRLPDGDGLALIPVLRTRPEPPPVIVLTALDDIPERVTGLDAGAEDYMIKPCATDELLARLRVILRRSPRDTTRAIVRVGALAYDLGAREASVGAAALSLPRRELAILDTLIRRVGRVVLREVIESAVYGFDDDIQSNALEAHMSRLRRRLADARAGVVLHVVRGVGYMLRAAA